LLGKGSKEKRACRSAVFKRKRKSGEQHEGMRSQGEDKAGFDRSPNQTRKKMWFFNGCAKREFRCWEKDPKNRFGKSGDPGRKKEARCGRRTEHERKKKEQNRNFLPFSIFVISKQKKNYHCKDTPGKRSERGATSSNSLVTRK